MDRDERLFFRRQKQVTGRLGEELIENPKTNDRIFLSRRDQHRAIRNQRQAEETLVVAKRPEEDSIELAAVLLQVRKQVGHLGSILAKPRLFVGTRGATAEDRVTDVAKAMQRSGARDRKPADVQRAHLRHAGRILVLPADMVLRAGRQDRDVM